MTGRAPDRALRALARAHGVHLAYVDTSGRRVAASRDGLLGVLRALGCEVESTADAGEELRRHRLDRWRRVVEPVVVAWDGHPTGVGLRLPAAVTDRRVDLEVALEEGGEVRERSAAPVTGRTELEGRAFVEREAALTTALPPGVHRLRATAGAWSGEGWILSAPRRVHGGDDRSRSWGVFAPLYALRDEPDRGVGDLRALERLGHRVADLGGHLVSVLPLLAAYLDRPCEPSPYAPVSRHYWNEAYLDLSSLGPEVDAQEPVGAAPGDLVDWAAVGRRVRSALTAFAARVDEEPARAAALRQFLRERPDVRRYATFRAVQERRGDLWPDWPARLRDGAPGRGDYDPAVVRRHECAQWLAHEQLGRLATRLASRGVGLSLDLPLGSHPGGYDTWSESRLFARAVSTGAPPDAFFAEGQRWGFPPLLPQVSRRDAHAHLRACLAHQMRIATMLRVDHVMGLHRLYWVPEGLEGRDGVYVSYPADELWAVLSLESHRHRCRVVGEDLGTVPRSVRRALGAHGALGTWVAEFELGAEGDAPARPPRRCVASLDTHDLPPFAAFWAALDIDQDEALGLVPPRRARRLRRERAALRTRVRAGLGLPAAAGADRVVPALIEALGASRAEAVIVAMEDLWLETRPQNVPGTTDEVPNWRRRAARSLDDVDRPGDATTILARLDRARRGRRGR